MSVLRSLNRVRFLGGMKNHRDLDAIRKRNKRSEAARIFIPEVVDWNRRERCLADPELFLKTYLADRYKLGFNKCHRAMMDAIVGRAKRGGRQAVAAPRGIGKSELIKGLLMFLFLSGLVRFPLVGGATKPLGHNIYTDFMHKIETNDLLLEDFPEVCWPVRSLEGAHNRAKRQHVNGELTGIIWSSTKILRMPHVAGSPYGGFLLSYFGLDSAFRGMNIRGARPDFILIDDPETRESAKSYDQSVDREEIIDRDVAGLVSQEDNLAIVVLTTVQNCYSMSSRLTDRKLRPAFNGMRFGMIEKWPTNMDMWNDYMAMRHTDQVNGDEHGLNAVQFYLDNQEAMDEGAEMLSDHFVRVVLDDNTLVVHSAIQQAFNKIADTNLESYKTEYQNNPPEDEQDQTLQLTAKLVAQRISGIERGFLPPADERIITMGLDLGDRYGHWCKIAWFGNATGVIIDYGIMEIPGYIQGIQGEALKLAILRALMDFCPTALAENPPDFAFIDSGDGDHADAVYRAILDLDGSPWAASKGIASKRYRTPHITEANKETLVVYDECHARHQDEWDVWLYNINTEFYKHDIQRMFVTPTFKMGEYEGGERVFSDGSLSLFSPATPKAHMSFAHHMVAENRMQRFEAGKGWIRKWVEHSKNNHYLDAVALARAAAAVLGVKLIKPIEEIEGTPEPAPQTFSIPSVTMPDGRPYSVLER